MLGGDFSLDSKPGKGTRVTVELPLSVTGRPVTAKEGGAP